MIPIRSAGRFLILVAFVSAASVAPAGEKKPVDPGKARAELADPSPSSSFYAKCPDHSGLERFFAGRVGEAKKKLLESGGGSEKTEAAVATGLDFLVRFQKKDGSWALDDERLKDGEARSADDPKTTWTAHPPSPHDLRRTVETRLAALGVAKDIRDRCLNHAASDVGSRHYDRRSHLPEKRDALRRQ